MRVLHVHSGNLYGGVETLMVTLARERHLCLGMEPHFALCFEGRLHNELAASGVPVYPLGNVRVSRPLSVWDARRALSNLLKREHFDVVFCHSTWSQAIFGRIANKARVPLTFWLHGPADGIHWLERWARRIVPDLVLCNSHFTASTLANLYSTVRAEVIYCPVAFPEYTYSKAELLQTRAELNTRDDAIVIIHVSRVEECKGHRLHLEALSRLKDVPGWVCWMVGGAQKASEAHYLEQIKALACELEITDRIRFVGQRSDVPKLLAAADIHCQPNTGPEGFGITFIEALQAQLPVVTTAIGSAKEIIDDSCGRLVPDGNVDILASSLRQLIKDSDLRLELGKAGRSRARKLCDPEIRMSELFTTIAEFMRNGKHQAAC